MPHIIEQYENASTKMLDRWSVLTYDGPLFQEQTGSSGSSSETSSYEGHLSQMLETVLNSSKSEEVLDAADKLNKLSRDVQHRQVRIYSTQTQSLTLQSLLQIRDSFS